jgi:hypothetical protein
MSEGAKEKHGVLGSTGPAERGGVLVIVLGKTNSGLFMGDFGWAVRGVSGYVGPWGM